MADLLEGYKRYLVSKTDTALLHQVIKDAVYPFNPGDIFVMMEDLIGKRVLHISSRNWPSISTTFDISNLDLVVYPEAIQYELARMVGEHFKNMEYIAPEDNHILGEN